MADNVNITSGAGTAIAADDVGSVYYQKVKLDGGGDGATTPILAGGGVEASALRVTLASDSTGVVSVDDNSTTLSVDDGGGALTVDGTVAVTNADITTIAGAVAGTEMQVDVVSSALPSGAATSALQTSGNTLLGGGLPAALGAGGGLKVDGSGTGLPVTGTFWQATQPVSIAAAVPVTDNSTTLSVDDGGGALTVDGTVAVTNADLTTVAGAVSGGHMQVDVLTAPTTAVTGTFWQATQPVSAAALPLPSGAATSALQGGGLPAALGAGGGLKVDGSGTALPVSGTVTIQDGGNTITVDGTVTAAGVQPAVADFTLSLDTSAYATGDVLAATQEIASAVASAAGKALLVSIVLNDKDDQGGALDLVFLRTNVSIGAENSAVSVADADADEILGIVQVAAGDWLDLGGCRVATIPASRCGIELTAGAGATSLYLAAISRDAKTYSASGITGHLGLERY